MTLFDLLFIALFLAAVATLVWSMVLAVRGEGRRVRRNLTTLVICSAGYIGLVYLVTALSTPKILHPGDPWCLDDWCFTVDHVNRIPASPASRFDVDLRLFSRARRASQRENGAKDVYLVDEKWNRYDPAPAGAQPPLNVLLRPGESVNTSRTFRLPADVKNIRLALDHSNDGFPFCMIIGECAAFHKGTTMQLVAGTEK